VQAPSPRLSLATISAELHGLNRRLENARPQGIHRTCTVVNAIYQGGRYIRDTANRLPRSAVQAVEILLNHCTYRSPMVKTPEGKSAIALQEGLE